MFDILIKNGFVVDGVNDTGTLANIGIIKDKIAWIGKDEFSYAEKVIYANGLTVTPGFIDMHSHDDVEVLSNPMIEPKVMQGVTTQLVGHCGVGPAPLSMDPDNSNKWKNTTFPLLGLGPLTWHWKSFADYVKTMEDTKSSLNNMALVSHGAIRAYAVGLENKPLSSQELNEMKSLTKEAMDAGAAGLSVGLIYLPSLFGSEEELSELCKVVHSSDGIFVPHGRSVGHQVTESVDEILRITESSGVKLHIPHLQILGRSSWNKIAHILTLIDEYQNKYNQTITFDIHTYDAASTFLLVILPPWAISGGAETIMNNLLDATIRQKIKDALMVGASKDTPGWDFVPELIDWDNIMITSVATDKNKELEGKSFSEISDIRGQDPYDAALDLILEEAGLVTFVISGVYSDQLDYHFLNQNGAFGTDGLPCGHPHPRLYGTFARVIENYVVKQKKMTIEKAVKKMAALPADILGLEKRGKIQEDNRLMIY